MLEIALFSWLKGGLRYNISLFLPKLDCAQIVPVKVKYLQTVPSETKNRLKIGIDSTG
jgi:hypothetical protein